MKTKAFIAKKIVLDAAMIKQILALPKSAKINFTGDRYDYDSTTPGHATITWEETEELDLEVQK